jgi:hypothetical protein
LGKGLKEKESRNRWGKGNTRREQRSEKRERQREEGEEREKEESRETSRKSVLSESRGMFIGRKLPNIPILLLASTMLSLTIRSSALTIRSSLFQHSSMLTPLVTSKNPRLLLHTSTSLHSQNLNEGRTTSGGGGCRNNPGFEEVSTTSISQLLNSASDGCSVGRLELSHIMCKAMCIPGSYFHCFNEGKWGGLDGVCGVEFDKDEGIVKGVNGGWRERFEGFKNRLER